MDCSVIFDCCSCLKEYLPMNAHFAFTMWRWAWELGVRLEQHRTYILLDPGLLEEPFDPSDDSFKIDLGVNVRIDLKFTFKL